MKPAEAAQPDSPDPAPYTLLQVDSTPVPASIPPLAVTWHDVHFPTKTKDPDSDQVVDKQILSCVSGEALPGELLVIMGPSGAGKSTLLNCIANRNTACTGSVHVGSSLWTPELMTRACYIFEDDVFYGNLTVQGHLLLQAELRLGARVPPSERAARVTEVISELNLTTVANSLIGDVNANGLSKVDRKRLSLATELLTNPSILFVDEPTSGLDSIKADTVVRQLQSLARKGHTVIATIHHPPSSAFALIDKLHLLADGHTVFRGRASESLNHFAHHGVQCPPFMNPAEFFVQQLTVLDNDTEAASRVKSLCGAWAEVEKTTALSSAPQLDVVMLETPSKPKRNNLVTQLGVLCRRNLTRLVRDPVAFRGRIIATIVVALLVGLIFPQLEVSQKNVQNYTATLFFTSLTQFAFSASQEFGAVPLEIPIVLREHEGGLYHVLSWYLAKNVSELPLQLIIPMIYLLPFYYLVGYDSNTEMFFTFYLFIVLVISTATCMGYMVSCLAKRPDMATKIGMLFILPCVIFGGLFVNTKSTPVYFLWIQQMSPIKYCFHGLMRAFWTTVPVIPCPTGTSCRFTSGAGVLANSLVHTDRLVIDCIIMLSINLGCRILGALFLLRHAAKRNA